MDTPTPPAAPAAHTLARRNDPYTSKLAGEAATHFAEGQYAMILELLSTDKPLGAEQIGRACGLAAYQVRKRLPELEAAGLAKVIPGETRRTSSYRLERLWVKVAAQGVGS